EPDRQVVNGGEPEFPSIDYIPTASCPRISPPGFFAVCTFTYSLCCANADLSEPLTFAEPFTGLLHGPQIGTTTGPDAPFAPMWMCAAVAGPVSPLNVSVQLSVLPFSVALNVPWAFASFTTCFGTSCVAVNDVVQMVARVAAPESAASARAQAPPATSGATSFFTAPPWSWGSLLSCYFGGSWRTVRASRS